MVPGFTLQLLRPPHQQVLSHLLGAVVFLLVSHSLGLVRFHRVFVPYLVVVVLLVLFLVVVRLTHLLRLLHPRLFRVHSQVQVQEDYYSNARSLLQHMSQSCSRGQSLARTRTRTA